MPPEQLVAAIHTVANGDALLAPAITCRLIEAFVQRSPDGARTPPPEVQQLTPQRGRHPAPDRPRAVQRRDRRRRIRHQAHHHDPRGPDPDEARAARSRPGRRLRLRAPPRVTIDVAPPGCARAASRCGALGTERCSWTLSAPVPLRTVIIRSWRLGAKNRFVDFLTLLDRAMPVETGTALDLGCGQGHWLVRALAGRPGLRAIGVDINAAIIADAAETLARADLFDRADLVTSDAKTASFPHPSTSCSP
jgi:SAM-dependent methyltransferase